MFDDGTMLTLFDADADRVHAEMLALLCEVLRAGNVNMRGVKAAIQKASPSWTRRAREVVKRAELVQKRRRS